MTANPPVFLRPAGRTGGTLFVTMLDAHPDLAMSYEIYEDRLRGDDGEPLPVTRAIALLEDSADADPLIWVKAIPEKNLKTFVARARRGDVEVREVLDQLRAFRAEGRDLATVDDRLAFIDRLMIFRMHKTGKRFWGGKAFADPELLHLRHPDAAFFAMVRDGRDVLASRLNTGNFRTSARACAEDWCGKTRAFRAFARTPGVRAMEVHYETLVETPEPVLREACALIGLPYDAAMLEFAGKDMALFRNPHGHLSHRQIRAGLNQRSVGRWRDDLTPEDVRVFEEIAGDVLREYGYELGG